ncbi:MAG: photosystem II reaction center protein PsbN [Acaryochloris sp. RU_4_1]|jgi:PsbN protein|nr:photosystem II reaction center protein PsbN [Acaryochloris sp. SU_5_25]NJM68413.1 photosystem II reaction center protein PsbN [Acaryochloris sp. RU_4_1]NJN39114.1 photosystem II reaction center protein PsbN [Acaryochloridaceae cyanobacterium CSU_3_4]NJR57103.1 photosystem II reaction center protein PsbN [Acaryochloris sp. CRU_2_0]
MQFSDPATVLIISILAVTIVFTAISLYTAFGPPSKQLADPFEEHED